MRARSRIRASHRPDIVSGDCTYRMKKAIPERHVRSLHQRPRAAVPMHCDRFKVTVYAVAHGPDIVLSQSRDSVENAEGWKLIRARHNRPTRAVPMLRQSFIAYIEL